MNPRAVAERSIDRWVTVPLLSSVQLAVAVPWTALSRWCSTPLGTVGRLLRVLCLLGALLTFAQVVFLTLVVWAAAVPNADLITQLRNAYATGQLTTAREPRTSMGNLVEQFGECVGLSLDLGTAPYPDRLQSLSLDRGSALLFDRFRNVMTDSVVAGCGPLPGLLSGHAIPYGSNGSYFEFRYWNGYSVLERPLVAWFGVAATRSVVAALLIGSLIFFVATMGKAAGRVGGLALVAPLLLTTDFPDLPQSINHAIGMASLLAGAAGVAVVVMKRGPGPIWVASAALLSGAVYCYLDIFVNPPLALGLTIGAAAFSSYRLLPAARRSSLLAFTSGVAGAAWLAGWALTWVTRWLISAVLFGPSFVYQYIGGEVMRRLSGTENGTLDVSFGEATRANLDVWLYGNPARMDIILGCAGLAMVFMLVAVARHRSAGLREMALLFAPGLLPFPWFETLRNHSVIHAPWTYRSLALTLGLAMAASAYIALHGHVPRRTGDEQIEPRGRTGW